MLKDQGFKTVRARALFLFEARQGTPDKERSNPFLILVSYSANGCISPVVVANMLNCTSSWEMCACQTVYSVGARSGARAIISCLRTAKRTTSLIFWTCLFVSCSPTKGRSQSAPAF